MEDESLVLSPRPLRVMLAAGQMLTLTAGINRLPSLYRDHWYLRANGVVAVGEAAAAAVVATDPATPPPASAPTVTPLADTKPIS